jgi:hypothetical protein
MYILEGHNEFGAIQKEITSNSGAVSLTPGNYTLHNVSTTEALNPQAVFFIQVENNSIVRSDNITLGQTLSSSLMQWTGTLKNSVLE